MKIRKLLDVGEPLKTTKDNSIPHESETVDEKNISCLKCYYCKLTEDGGICRLKNAKVVNRAEAVNCKSFEISMSSRKKAIEYYTDRYISPVFNDECSYLERASDGKMFCHFFDDSRPTNKVECLRCHKKTVDTPISVKVAKWGEWLGKQCQCEQCEWLGINILSGKDKSGKACIRMKLHCEARDNNEPSYSEETGCLLFRRKRDFNTKKAD